MIYKLFVSYFPSKFRVQTEMTTLKELISKNQENLERSIAAMLENDNKMANKQDSLEKTITIVIDSQTKY